MNSLGIDPGKSGALVLLDPNAVILLKEKTPLITSTESRDEYDLPRLVDILKSVGTMGPYIAVVEKQHPMPARIKKSDGTTVELGGSIGNFNRGFASALYQTIFTVLGQSFLLIPSKTWQKAMFAGINATDTKQASILAASRIWPGVDFRATPRAVKPNHGLTDAALMAMFGLQKLVPQPQAPAPSPTSSAPVTI